jgi:predicted dehydrogenase
MSQPTRVGVIGVGALGQHHARVYASLPGATLTGVHDAKPERAREVAAQHGGVAYEDLRALLAAVDAVSVAVPTLAHHRLVKVCLEAGKDVLVEKPMTSTIAEADELIETAARCGKLLQVGHVERFNPDVDVIRTAAPRPRFIEVHRLGSFPGRSLDIDVVLDLMIHDLDIVLALEGSEPVQIDAVGVPVLTPKVDIANARLRFASGLIANLTASRVSGERVRKFRVFAQGTYVSADLAAREARVYRLVSGPGGGRGLEEERIAAADEEPLRRQLAAFVDSTRTRTPVVSGAEGRRALALACRILEQMDPHAARL